jgi:hypothetical protein
VVLFRENHISGTVESGDVGNSGYARDDKKERDVARKGWLLKERVVGKGKGGW